MKAWYFAPKDERLKFSDGRKIQVGKMHTVKGKPILCQQGLHGAIKLLDALAYADSCILYRTDISRHVVYGKDKIAGQRRIYLARINAESILMDFARKQALINISLIEPFCTAAQYKLIQEYLNTGNDALRAAAYAASDAASDAAYGAYDAAYAAGAAASAAYGAAYDAAHGATYAAYDAAYAARAAARGAARAAASGAANEMLEELVMDALNKQGYYE